MRPFVLLTRDDRARLDAAADWMLRLQLEELGEEQLAEWLAWYDEPENRLAFDEMQGVQEDVRAIDRKERAAFAAMFLQEERGGGALDFAGMTNLTARMIRGFAESLSTAVYGMKGWIAGVAGVSMVAVAIGLVVWNADWVASARMNASYRTDRGAHSVEKLADGSVVRLGGGSSFSLNFTREVRYLVLESGEALFEVAKDSGRPFIVQAGAVRVKAVGTEFNVRRSVGNTFVAVKEGAVEVTQDGQSSKFIAAETRASPDAAPQDAVRIGAGEQAAATFSAPSLTVVSIVPATVASWQQGRLEFVDEPLQSVVATVNRYSKRDIVLTDPTVMGEMRFTGIVMESRIDEWVKAIQEVFPLKATTAGKGAILLSPASL